MSTPKRARGKNRAERLKHEVDRLRRELAERDRQNAEQAKPIAEDEADRNGRVAILKRVQS